MEQTRWRRFSAASKDVRSAFAAVRGELGIADGYPKEVLKDADAAAAKPLPREGYVDRRDIEFVTIDPASSLDLDQAVEIEKLHPGPAEKGVKKALYRVHYAIADLGYFVTPGSALDNEVNERGLTAYGPDQRFGLHPPVLSEDAGSLLPDQDRPAALWTIDLDAKGEIVDAKVERAIVRSRAKISYDQVQQFLDDGVATLQPKGTTPIPPQTFESLKLLKEVGLLRQAVEHKRGGVSLEVPDQEVEEDIDGDFNLLFRRTLPVEGWNAQISLLTGIAAAHMMEKEGVGILRTLPPASSMDLRRLRATAKALGINWPKNQSYGAFLSSLDSSNPKQAALLAKCTTLFKGAGYLAFDHDLNVDADTDKITVAASSGEQVHTDRRHSALATEYAHVTAPLRRLVDRYGTEICLAHCAGRPVPPWVLEKLPLLPAEMAAAYRTSHKYERKCADVVEASLLANRVGEVFDGVVIDAQKRKVVGADKVVTYKPATRGEVMLADPAVIARIDSADGTPLELGEPVKAKLVEVSVPEGLVKFEAVNA